jgi:predicted nucleic acid-binding protein
VLGAAFGEVLIPEAVYHEVVAQGLGRPGATEVASTPWIRVEQVRDPGLLRLLPDGLGPGEAQALILASERTLPILLDEAAARREARRLGVWMLGSVAVLLDAKQRGLLPAVKPVIDRMVAAGFRLSQALYAQTLLQADER